MLTKNYPQNTSLRAEKLDSFRRQMADYARGERLRELRDSRHLSQEEAAHEIGVSVKTLRAWEKGSGIRWGNAKSVAKFYGVEPESLVEREPGATPDLMSDLSPSDPQLSARFDRLEEMLVELAADVADLGTELAARTIPVPKPQRAKRGGRT